MIFPVKDHGKPLWWPIPAAPPSTSRATRPFRHLHRLPAQIRQGGAAAGATVLLSNHSEFDEAYRKGRMLASRKPGEASPFFTGADAIQRYFTVSSECASREGPSEGS